MIKSWEELGDYLAEFENRLKYIENSQGGSKEIVEQETSQEPEWYCGQWTQVTQLKAMVLHLQKKVNEHIDRKKHKDTI